MMIILAPLKCGMYQEVAPNPEAMTFPLQWKNSPDDFFALTQLLHLAQKELFADTLSIPRNTRYICSFGTEWYPFNFIINVF